MNGPPADAGARRTPCNATARFSAPCSSTCLISLRKFLPLILARTVSEPPSRTMSKVGSPAGPSIGTRSRGKASAASGTAAAGSDYAAKTGTLSFAAGETSKTIAVTVYGDRTSEPDETFTVALSGAPAGVILVKGQGVGTVVNDDARKLMAATTAPAGTRSAPSRRRPSA